MKELTVENVSYSNVKKWISDFTRAEKVEFAIKCAELVIDLCNGSSDAPKKAIQAAKAWMLDPSDENKRKCKDAAYAAAAAAADAYAAAYAADAADAAAYADAYAADAYADAYAAYAAADAADAAAYAAADADAYAAAYAAYAAADAAYAAADAAAADVKSKIIGFIESKLKQNRTKTTYEKVEFEHAWQAVKAFEEGEELYRDLDVGDKHNSHTKISVCFDAAKYYRFLYRKVEREVTWKDEVADWVENNIPNEDEFTVNDDGVRIDTWMMKSQFIKMCHLVASLTDKPE